VHYVQCLWSLDSLSQNRSYSTMKKSFQNMFVTRISFYC